MVGMKQSVDINRQYGQVAVREGVVMCILPSFNKIKQK
jgi:hypothetical protein